jgi:hypothetical protein
LQGLSARWQRLAPGEFQRRLEGVGFGEFDQ